MVIRSSSVIFKSNPFSVVGIEWRRKFPGLLERLPQIIGKSRYQRLLNRPYIPKLGLKNFLDAIIIGMADVQVEDLTELFTEIKDPALENVRHLSAENTLYLRSALEPYFELSGLPKAMINSCRY